MVCLDWGDTVMRVFPEFEGPMVTWPEVAAVSGTGEALAELHRSYRIVLLTNAGASTEDQVRAALARVGLDRHFDAIVLSRELGVTKADPTFYEKAMAALGCQPEEAVMVGDSYEADVVSAKKAGLKALWFAPGGASASPPGTAHDAVLTDLADLPRVVRSLPG